MVRTLHSAHSQFWSLKWEMGEIRANYTECFSFLRFKHRKKWPQLLRSAFLADWQLPTPYSSILTNTACFCLLHVLQTQLTMSFAWSALSYNSCSFRTWTNSFCNVLGYLKDTHRCMHDCHYSYADPVQSNQLRAVLWANTKTSKNNTSSMPPPTHSHFPKPTKKISNIQYNPEQNSCIT